jgi:hypothetical protein
MKQGKICGPKWFNYWESNSFNIKVYFFKKNQ